MYKLKNRKNKYIATICFVLSCIMLGFAAFSATLGFETDTIVGKINYDVHFENIEIIESTIHSTKFANINEDDYTQIDCGAELTIPGEYFEFEVDVVNKGSLNAILSSIMISGLNEQNQKFLNVSYKYADGTELEKNAILNAGDSVRIKIRMEFLMDITWEDLPDTGTSVEFKISMKYSHYNSNAIKKLYTKMADEYDAVDNVASKYVTYADGVQFGYVSSNTNGKGLYLRAGTENDKYPIYYYRGEVINNNVLFGEKCWKIVRTTETGGVKLLYNGVPNVNNSDGMCANAGEDSQIGISPFGVSYNNIAYIGYMYSSNTSKYSVYTKDMSTTGNIIYGNSVIFEDGKYILQDTKEMTFGSNISNYHYTCFSAENNCSSVNYIFYIDIAANKAYYYYLSNGKDINDALNESLLNENTRNELNSPIKSYIDNWYSGENGIIEYTDYLEDTIWCNDREISELAGFDPNGGDVTSKLLFTSGLKETNNPTLNCINKLDKFTLKSSAINSNEELGGNQLLDYSVGLLTLDELSLAGLGSTSFVKSGSPYWSMSPRYVTFNSPYIVRINDDGRWGGAYPSISGNGVRPSVSLSNEVLVMSGSGTESDPYVVGKY